MTPHLVVRVDGDTFAVAHRGDLRDSMSRAMDAAMPDPGSTVHAAIVLASDAGAARLTPVAYWVGAHDVDEDYVRATARDCGLSSLCSDAWIANVIEVANAIDAWIVATKPSATWVGSPSGPEWD